MSAPYQVNTSSIQRLGRPSRTSLGGQRRPRTDQAHLAAKHVEELRDLVDRGDAQEAADPGNARIVRNLEHRAVGLVEVDDMMARTVGAIDHGAQLDERERPAVLP